MRWIPTPDTKIGMVVGEAVKDSAGRTLAERGQRVSGDLIAALKRSGVQGIFAVNADNRDAESADGLDAEEVARQREINEITKTVRRKLDVRFRKHRDKPVMRTVRALAEKQMIKAQVDNLTHSP